jgi:hypothetical protein
MRRWLESLSDAFWAWLDHIMEEPEERTDPPHAYAQPGTIGSYRYGNRCLYCDTRDDQRREHNEIACTRSYQELA